MKYAMSIFLICSFLFLALFGASAIYGYIFPLRYQTEIAVASETFEVDPVLVASVIKSESNFQKDVVSVKGAEGLMQILPSTAEYLAKKLKYGEYDLKKAEDNIMLGTYYLSLLFDDFGDEKLVLCAYNAGPANVRKWLDNEKNLDKNGALKNIPFSETATYYKKCMQAKKYYNLKRNYLKTV